MPKKTTYRVREGAGGYVAGRRVKPGLELELTEEQARYPLIARQIELAQTSGGPKPTPVDDAPRAKRKAS